MRGNGLCSCSLPRHAPSQRRPIGADASGEYSGHGRLIRSSDERGDMSSVQSELTVAGLSFSLGTRLNRAVDDPHAGICRSATVVRPFHGAAKSGRNWPCVVMLSSLLFLLSCPQRASVEAG